MAIPESRRRKLEMLTRSIARGDFGAAARLISGGAQPKPGPGEVPAPIPLAEACPGLEQPLAVPGGTGSFHLVRRTLAEVSPAEAGICRQFEAVLRGARQRFDELSASAALCRVANGGPEDVLLLDLETCGFSGSCIFLVGLGRQCGGDMVFEQLLARSYAEEAAILQGFADRYAAAGVLVTFNGKAFDMNMIRERAAFHAVPLPTAEPPHLDLLHECRRLYRRRVPDCRLQTLERHLCGRLRAGDIPGAAIPDAYHRFVSTGDARQLRDILHHNLLDMLTMAQLLCAVLTGSEPPELV